MLSLSMSATRSRDGGRSITRATTPVSAAVPKNVARFEAVAWRPRQIQSTAIVTATDISAAALEVARQNATRHGVQDRLALVETSDGIGYILKAGDTLADGRLVEINANTVVFAIVPKPGSTTNKVVLRLPSD